MDTTADATMTANAARTRHLSSARLILALMLATPFAFGLLFGGTSFLRAFPPVIIMSALGAIIAVVVLLLDRRWVTLVAATTALLMFGLGVSDPTPGAMTRPSLGLQMSWGHAARFAGLVGVLAGIAEIRRARAGTAGRLARAVPFAATLAAGLALGVGATTQAALSDEGFAQGGTVLAFAPDATLHVVEEDNLFVVDGSAPPNALVRIVVKNQDDFIHSFTATGIDVDNLGSSTTEILARAPGTPGDWIFYCKYHPEMKAAVRVQ